MNPKSKETDMEDFKFEKAIEKLEKIVEFLEAGDVELDEALKKYEEGVRLSRFCTQKLSQAEKKIEILTRSLNGTLSVEPFDGEEAEEKPKKSKKEPSNAGDSQDEGLLF